MSRREPVIGNVAAERQRVCRLAQRLVGSRAHNWRLICRWVVDVDGYISRRCVVAVIGGEPENVNTRLAKTSRCCRAIRVCESNVARTGNATPAQRDSCAARKAIVRYCAVERGERRQSDGLIRSGIN